MRKIVKGFCIILAVLLSTAFIGCGGGEQPPEPEDLSVVTENGVTYTLLEDDTYQITKATLVKGSNEIVVPDTVKEKTVTSVGVGAFRQLTLLKSVSLPDTVKKVGLEAFANCKLLSSVTANGLEEIGVKAFASCNSLTSFDFSSVKVIGENAFSASGLKSTVSLPVAENVGQRAFADVKISKLIVGSALQKIFLNTFEGCSITLTQVEFANDQEEWCLHLSYVNGTSGWWDNDKVSSGTIAWKQLLKTPSGRAQFLTTDFNDGTFIATRAYRTLNP